MNRLCTLQGARWRLQIAAACALLCASFLFSDSVVNAQDVAEAARQEKSRKAAETKKQSHIYTNEDLQRTQILTPQDQTAAEARKKDSPSQSASETSPTIAPSHDTAAPESLGEIARRVRREKAERQAEQARKVPAPAPFSIELPRETSLAHPKPFNPAVVAPKSIQAKPPKPVMSTGSVKRDPFSRGALSVVAPGNSISAQPPKPVAPSASAITPTHIVVPPTTMHSSSVVSESNARSVIIRPGDSLWSLSRQYLGRGSRWREFLNENTGVRDPRQIQPGAVLQIPPVDSHSTRAPDAPPALRIQPPKFATISVRPGDSLWKLAIQHLGSGANWPCLANANPNLHDLDRIYPGQNVTLPTSCISTTQASPTD